LSNNLRPQTDTMTLTRTALTAAVGLLLATAASAQHTPGAHQHSPYAGMQQRSVKALSDQQVTDLRAGKGMSLALPAELNGYPGPAHALELAEQLKLSPQQRARTQELFGQMQREAKAVGEEVIAAETALDTLFREKRATAESVSAATSKAAQAQGKLRETHLRYHLTMMEVLSAEQVAAYNRLRGY
jgi:Spy/CpxP family protein refolding chaperone